MIKYPVINLNGSQVGEILLGGSPNILKIRSKKKPVRYFVYRAYSLGEKSFFGFYEVKDVPFVSSMKLSDEDVN